MTEFNTIDQRTQADQNSEKTYCSEDSPRYRPLNRHPSHASDALTVWAGHTSSSRSIRGVALPLLRYNQPFDILIDSTLRSRTRISTE
jgi:hypothetical protein